MAPRRHPLRKHIVTLFVRGELVSVQEAVLICDASRQAISRWLKAASIDIGVKRLAWIAKQRARAWECEDGKPAARRPSKLQMRKDLERAVAQFNKRNGS